MATVYFSVYFGIIVYCSFTVSQNKNKQTITQIYRIHLLSTVSINVSMNGISRRTVPCVYVSMQMKHCFWSSTCVCFTLELGSSRRCSSGTRDATAPPPPPGCPCSQPRNRANTSPRLSGLKSNDERGLGYRTPNSVFICALSLMINEAVKRGLPSEIVSQRNPQLIGFRNLGSIPTGRCYLIQS